MNQKIKNNQVNQSFQANFLKILTGMLYFVRQQMSLSQIKQRRKVYLIDSLSYCLLKRNYLFLQL